MARDWHFRSVFYFVLALMASTPGGLIASGVEVPPILDEPPESTGTRRHKRVMQKGLAGQPIAALGRPNAGIRDHARETRGVDEIDRVSRQSDR